MKPHDTNFRRECAAFIFATLGASSDDAAAYFACSECGRRWGNLVPADQSARRWCSYCLSGARPVSVDPMRPEWWDGRPPGADYDEDEPAADEPPAMTDKEIGEMVHRSAIKLRDRDGRKLITSTHMAAACKAVARRLESLGHISPRHSELRRLRKKYADAEKSRRNYIARKDNKEVKHGA